MTENTTKAVAHTSMPSKADKRAEALRENLKKRKELIKSQKAAKK
tara:strand:- start:452 stop:586 length:135 start_codon:yes stop_codon:yes gene_type:complete